MDPDLGAEVINGCTIRYRARGEGPAVALTPGGRHGMDAVCATAEALAARGCRVLEWDRVNTGASDVWVGPGTEHDRWSDDLAELVRRLEMAPAWIAGGSVGATVSLRTAIRHPEVTRGVIVWSVPGGFYSSQRFGYSLHVPFIDAASRGGMAEVATTEFFAERVAANPANADRLAAMDPVAFAAAMRRWNESYNPIGAPVVDCTEAELRNLAVPTLVFSGNEDFHPPAAAAAVHELVAGSELLDGPWAGDEWTGRIQGVRPGSIFDLYLDLIDPIVKFIGLA
jgi:pimeloyl-ACP methyl ester carboxylesterase